MSKSNLAMIASPPAAVASAAPHLAGAKIRAWRDANGVTVEALGARLGRALGRAALPRQTIYNWESRGKDARPDVRRVLQQWGVCDSGDWLEPAPANAAQADARQGD